MAAAASLLFSGTALAAAKVSCLKCHPQHCRKRGSCVSCHKGDPRSDRLRIAHHDLVAARFSWYGIADAPPVVRGNKLLESFACRRCHTTGGKGNRLASNLDRLPSGTSAQDIFDSIRSPALLMPQFRLEEGAMTDLVNAVLAGASRSAGQGREIPQVVHFDTEKRSRENVFDKKCGACHRMFTAAKGALGRGDVGPNLSGLFSEFYPPTSAGNRRWSAESLEKWLKNPRESRPMTRMRPVEMEKREFHDLLTLVHPEPSRLATPR